MRSTHPLDVSGGKYGLSVVTSGGGDERPIVGYLNNFLITTGATPVDAVWAEMGTTREGRLEDSTREQAFIAGRNLVEAWRDKRRLASVERIQEAHRERMLALIRHHKEEWPHEYKYWQERRGI